MMNYNKYNNFNLPQELLDLKTKTEDVNIIIGENGSGKSLLLSRLSDYYVGRNYKNVIVIANSIHDKFRNKRDNRYHALKGSNGRKQVKDIVKQTLINISEDSQKRLNFATQALDYVGFDGRIGFRITFLKDIKKKYYSIDDLLGETQRMRNGETFFNKESFEELISLIYKYQNFISNSDSFYNYQNQFDSGRIFWFETKDNDYYQKIEQFFLLNFFKWERLLVKYKVIKPIEIFLSKQGISVPLLNASSGELSLIASIIYISSIIEPNSVILIDEPENSLHPKWQREYVNRLISLFYNYQPRIVIATHSPLIISGAEIEGLNPSVFKSNGFEYELQHNQQNNIEEVYYNLFDTITPENRTLSNILVDQLNRLERKEIRLEEFLSFLNPIYENVSDMRQTKMLNGISELAKKIVRQRKD